MWPPLVDLPLPGWWGEQAAKLRRQQRSATPHGKGHAEVADAEGAADGEMVRMRHSQINLEHDETHC
eukprot:5371973-Prymnesium_polylepis.1